MIVFFDPSTNKVVAIYSGGTSASWEGMTRIDDPEGSFAAGVHPRHHKIEDGEITEMTQAEKDATQLPRRRRLGLNVPGRPAPQNQDVKRGQSYLHFDKTPSDSKLVVTGRDSAGTIVTGSIDLN